jgi:Zn-dependent M28 family amino/carboxypeptidase
MVLMVLVGGWYAMIRMPNESFQGPIPPLSADEQVLEQELRSHVFTLAGEIGERNLWHYDKLQQAAGYIRTTFQRAGYDVSGQEYLVSGKTCQNIEVEAKGTTRPDEIVLVGAHYDSVKGSPGANDNGTGVAAVLALAGRLANSQPSRTIRFVAFVNEEPPFFQSHQMGSRVYARRPRERGEQITLMVSLETIGYYTEEAGSQSYPFPLQLIYPRTGNFIAFVSNTDTGPWVRKTIDSFRQHTQFPSEGAALFGWLPGVGWSDHWAFWKEGFPALMVTDTALFRDPYYHTGNDTPDHLHYDHLARVTAGLHQVIEDIANKP